MENIRIQVCVSSAKQKELHEFLSTLPKGGLAEFARVAMLEYVKMQKGKSKPGVQNQTKAVQETAISTEQLQHALLELLASGGIQLPSHAPRTDYDSVPVVAAQPANQTPGVAPERPGDSVPIPDVKPQPYVSAQDQIPPPPEDDHDESARPIDEDGLAALSLQAGMF